MSSMSGDVKRNRKQLSKQSSAQGDARRDRWKKHRIERRAEFVDAALRALDTHGPEFGMEDVAAEAGVTKPVLYRHFTDKADLYVALGQHGTQILFNRLMPALNEELAPLPRIRSVIDAFFSTIEEYPNLYRLLARPSHTVERTPDSDIVGEDKEFIATAVTALLGDYMRAFGLDSGSAEPWAYGVVGLVQNTGEWWLERRSMGKDSVVEYTTQIIWAAIDGICRQQGVIIDPNRPLEVNKVIQFSPLSGSAEEAAE
ncbi:TetR/AcrR family transcriptional regulator [Haloechinothrix sp. YIM 98757]|uniref:TetR/AcrR family transcriptional regulator n=2 Tax=Haloechinothrix aidingensis TaxID=2752311 RepID=A0A838AFD8_9PSEU|nr:TetR/AcrR family transcriptional regulator [Haloechinothrix aidingensis]MBA0127972.1 TetR/AcrR family transcriptional regulator [Haloechinothrix aidingensis]